VKQLLYLPRLPVRVAVFYMRCLLLALWLRDRWTLSASSRPRELAGLLAAARGRRTVVEDGTASGWTAAALAIADPDRSVVSFDPEIRPHRDRYLRLLDPATRARIETVQARTEQGPAALDRGSGLSVDLLFLDGDHSSEGIVQGLRAWQPVLARGALVALHDFGDPSWPEVAHAVAELGLRGDVTGTLFVAKAG
jgi:hypothetical protein